MVKRTKKKSKKYHGGRHVFVGNPWIGGDINTWGNTNYFPLSPYGGGTGDGLDILMSTTGLNPYTVGGGRKRQSKRRYRKKFYKGKKSKTHTGLDFTTRKKSKLYNEKRFKKLLGRKTVRAPLFPYIRGGNTRKMKGGYKGDSFFQNGINMFRNVGNGLGNIVRGFQGYPENPSPSPVVQPGMNAGRGPIAMPANITNLYKSAQQQVGKIG